jgi:aminoglycoside N3'-acetyltransferase/aminopeptidase-like protein
MSLEQIYQAFRSEFNGDNCQKAAAEFHRYPLRLSYSSYTEGIHWLADEYRKLGLEAEVIYFPADGKSVYADRHFPLAWDVEEAWAEVDGERIADYSECTYCVVPFSADSGGVCQGRLLPIEKLPKTGSLEDTVVLIAHYPSGKEIMELMKRGCKAFLTAVDTQPVHPSLDGARRWFNDLFGSGQIDARNRSCVGFSITPRIARQLMAKLESDSTPVRIRYLMKTSTYEGRVPAVSAILRGESERCFFVTAHAYEPHATNNVAGVACSLEIARTLSKLTTNGGLAKAKYSIRFFHGLENFSLYAWAMRHPEEMRNALGGVSLDSFGRLEVAGKREHFVLRRSLNIHPSAQHALAREILRKVSIDHGIDFEVKEASKNNEDLLQDPLLGPPWNLLYGSLWEEPLSTYPRCYFYHTSIDTPDKLSPLALKAAGVFAGTLAYFMASAGEAENDLMTELACEDWKRIVDDKCREALRLQDENASLRCVRAQRLAAWRRFSIASGMRAIGDPLHAADFKQYSERRIFAALQVLYGGEAPALTAKEHQEILLRTVPGPLGLGTISDELRELAAETQGCHSNEYWCLDESGTNLYHFDGKKTVFEVALAIWATRFYGLHEDADAFPNELRRCAKLAEVLLRGGLARLRELPQVTKEEIACGLRELGVEAGDLLMVHSSLSSFGRVLGGADTVIDALQEVVTESGIVAMPAFTDCAEGSGRGAYNPDSTTIEKWVGLIPETFRKRAAVLRSPHPTHSVCAWGRQAEEFLRQVSPMDTFAADSPWGKLLERKGKVVFLGESVSGNTFLHACEAWYNTYLDSTFALYETPDGVKSVLVKDYPGGCRGGWYKLGRHAAWFRELKARGLFQEAKVNDTVLTAYRADHFAAAVKEMFSREPAVLLHQNGCRDCARLRSKISI